MPLRRNARRRGSEGYGNAGWRRLMSTSSGWGQKNAHSKIGPVLSSARCHRRFAAWRAYPLAGEPHHALSRPATMAYWRTPHRPPPDTDALVYTRRWFDGSPIAGYGLTMQSLRPPAPPPPSDSRPVLRHWKRSRQRSAAAFCQRFSSFAGRYRSRPGLIWLLARCRGRRSRRSAFGRLRHWKLPMCQLSIRQMRALSASPADSALF